MKWGDTYAVTDEEIGRCKAEHVAAVFEGVIQDEPLAAQRAEPVGTPQLFAQGRIATALARCARRKATRVGAVSTDWLSAAAHVVVPVLTDLYNDAAASGWLSRAMLDVDGIDLFKRRGAPTSTTTIGSFH